jgi:hypothetical protein
MVMADIKATSANMDKMKASQEEVKAKRQRLIKKG